jgi:hypothetical protein
VARHAGQLTALVNQHPQVRGALEWLPQSRGPAGDHPVREQLGAHDGKPGGEGGLDRIWQLAAR